jgi:hypothetical protein
MASRWVRFRDTAEAIIGIGLKLVVAVGGTVAGIPGVPAWAIRVLTMIPSFMSLVEVAMPEAGSGPAKKTAVLNSTKALMDYLETQLTGGAKGTFDKLRTSIEGIIEGTIGLVNDLDKSIIADDVPPGTPPGWTAGRPFDPAIDQNP